LVNEAMACGLPVLVSSRCGCAGDLVRNGENGFVFEPARESKLAERMLLLSTMPDGTRAAMGRRSCEIIAKYSPENWASEVARIVRQ
jgi:glycosyltransferase involved in cell wall biosynthesis